MGEPFIVKGVTMRRFAVAASLMAWILLIGGVEDAHGQGRFDPRREARFMIDANLSYTFMTGDAADSLSGGPGIELAGLYQLGNIPLRLGAGAGYSRHSIEDIDASANRYDAFAAVELLIFSDETEMIPYLQARGGWMKLSNDYQDITTSISGIELGAVVGVDIPLSEAFSVDVSGQFGWFSGGDLVIDGRTDPGSSRSGTLFALRAGAFISL
jgi:hypothetical protein